METTPTGRVLAPLVALALALGGTVAHAAEGGAGHYVPGSLATLIDLPPTQPGWVVEAAYLRYDANASFDIPIAGLDSANLDVEVDSFLLGGFYTFELPGERLYYSLGGFVPYVWMNAKAEVHAGVGTVSRRDSTSGT